MNANIYKFTAKSKNGETWDVFGSDWDSMKEMAVLFVNMGHEIVGDVIK